MMKRLSLSLFAGRRASVLVCLALFGLGLVTPADAVRRREIENPIQPRADEEEPIKELNVPPPAYPRDANLIEFDLRGNTTNRFYVDGSSVEVSKDRIVRFVLVIRTPTNETNVRYAGMRCGEGHWKDYAFGTDKHTWNIDEDAQWKPIQELRYNDFQNTLYKDYFCVGGVLSNSPAGDAKKLVRLLKTPPRQDPRVYRRE